MSLFILNQITDEGMVVYTTISNGQVIISPSQEIVQNGLIEFFRPKDAKKIAEVSGLAGLQVANLSNHSMWVPISRLNYLPFFVLSLGVFFAFAIPMMAREVSICGFGIAVGQVIFPLMFVFTDLINELFGYQTTKRCIQFLAFLLVIVAALIQIILFLEAGDASQSSGMLFSDATFDDINHGFKAIYNGLPQSLLIDAGCLLVADTFNAYLFTRLKNWMLSRQLWLRSLCSSCFASITYSLIFATLASFCCWQWPGDAIFSPSFVVSAIVLKLPYFLAALPLLYGIRHYIYNQEAKMVCKSGSSFIEGDYINFHEPYDLQYHLQRVNKPNIKENQEALREMGKELKAQLDQWRLTNRQFHDYVKKNLHRLC